MFETAPYEQQRAAWPPTGRHILAHYDATTIVVYQAYRPSIGHAAARDGRFGDGWSRSRMSWIKPGFLWMMYRSGWATKPDQEVVLAIRLRREGFDQLLAACVHSSYVPAVYGDQATWAARLKRSNVRLQWDPDHTPHGAKEERRAIQLGLSGGALARFADRDVVAIDDVTAFAREQHARVAAHDLASLALPREAVYPVADPAVAAHLGLGERA